MDAEEDQDSPQHVQKLICDAGEKPVRPILFLCFPKNEDYEFFVNRLLNDYFRHKEQILDALETW